MIDKLMDFVDKHGWTIVVVGLFVGTVTICFAVGLN